MAENEIVTVNCTKYCGFNVTGPRDFCEGMYEEHEHQDEPGTREGSKWYEYAFSFYGAVIALFAAMAITAVLTHTPINW